MVLQDSVSVRLCHKHCIKALPCSLTCAGVFNSESKHLLATSSDEISDWWLLRLWRVKLLKPNCVERYYAPVPQVDHEQGGRLGAGVSQVQDHTCQAKRRGGIESLYNCSVFINDCTSVWNLVLWSSPSISRVSQNRWRLALSHQVEEPEGGQQDCTILMNSRFNIC